MPKIKTTKEESTLDEMGKTFLQWVFKPRSYFTKLLPIVLVIFLFDVFENIVSAGTSFSWVHSMTMIFLPEAYAKSIAITYLVLFETAKILVAVSFYLEILGSKFSFTKLLLLVGLTTVSIFQSAKGSKPLVYNYSKPAKLIPQSELAQHYNKEIASLDKQIAHLQNNDSKEITRVTAKDIKRKQNKKEEYTAKLEGLETARNSKNELIEVQASGVLTFTADRLKWIAIIFNLLSTLIFAPIQANFLFKSFKKFNLPPDLTNKKKPSKKQTSKTSNTKFKRKSGVNDEFDDSKDASFDEHQKQQNGNRKPDASKTSKSYINEDEYNIIINEIDAVLDAEFDTSKHAAIKLAKTEIQQYRSKLNKERVSEETYSKNIEKRLKLIEETKSKKSMF